MCIDGRNQWASDAGCTALIDGGAATLDRCNTGTIGEYPANRYYNDGTCDFMNHTIHSYKPFPIITLHAYGRLSRFAVDELLDNISWP
jgi:hypothetical protein